MKTKTRKSDLEGKKALFFQIGLIAALAVVLTAFEWQSSGNLTFEIPTDTRLAEPTIEMVITDPVKITPPPPPVISVAEIIHIYTNNVDIVENPNIFEGPNDDVLHYIITPREEIEVIETVPFLLIEKKPTFRGGDYNEFSAWVFSILKYPELAKQNGIQGKVILQFIIDTEGNVSDITVVRSPDKLLAEEAVRVVSKSPKWEPGQQRGKPAKVIFTFPISYRLQ